MNCKIGSVVNKHVNITKSILHLRFGGQPLHFLLTRHWCYFSEHKEKNKK